MAFYDNLKDKLSKTSQDAVQKTRNMADITKLNMANLEIEKDNKELYEKIGRIYCEKYINIIDDPDIQNLAEKYIENQKQLNDHKHQIQVLKGIQICTECGSEVAKGVTFCSQCGAKVPEWVEPEKQDTVITDTDTVVSGGRCPYCGIVLMDGSCPVCGYKE